MKVKPTKAHEKAVRELLDAVSRAAAGLQPLEQAQMCARALSDAYGIEYGIVPCEDGSFTIGPVDR